jgi:pentapeptide MXKDX repeat protein
MKTLIITLILSAFTLGTFASTLHPAMLQDTSKKHKMKKDSMKKDTMKPPAKPLK